MSIDNDSQFDLTDQSTSSLDLPEEVGKTIDEAGKAATGPSLVDTLIEAEELSKSSEYSDEVINPAQYDEAGKSVSSFEAMSAAATYFTPSLTAIQNMDIGFSDEVDPDWSASKALEDIKGTKYMKRWDQAVLTSNKQQLEAWKETWDRAEKNAIIMGSGSPMDMITGSVVGSIFGDPTTLTVVGSVIKGSRVGIVWKNLARQAGVGAAFIGQQEAQLRAMQPTRTMEEIRDGMVAGAIFNTLLAGVPSAARGLKTKAVMEQVEAMNKYLDGEVPIPESALRRQSAGAAAVDRRYMRPEDTEVVLPNWVKAMPEKYQNAFKWGVKNLIQIPWFHNPVHDGQLANSSVLRDFTTSVFNPVFETAGIARIPVERKIRTEVIKLARWYDGIEQGYSRYLKDATDSGNASPLSRKDFFVEVGKAFNRGDIHSNPIVQEMSREFRKKFKVLHKQMEELGLITAEERALRDEGDLTRAWDKELVRMYRYEGPNGSAGLRTRIANNLIAEDVKTRRASKAALKTGKSAAGDKLSTKDLNKLREGLEIREVMDMDQALAKADELIDGILGIGPNTVDMANFYKLTETAGTKFEKTRTIPGKNIDYEDFLVKDFFAVQDLYQRQMINLTQLKKGLMEAGYEDFNAPLKVLRDEYENALAGIDSKLSGEQKAKVASKLEREYANNRELMENMLKTMMGQLQHRTVADGAFTTLRTYQYFTSMGGIFFASMPDAAMAPLRFGFGKTLGKYQEVMSTMNTDIAKWRKEDLKYLGNALDHGMEMQHRLMWDGDAGSTIKSDLTLMSDRASAIFDRATLIEYSNDWHRAMARLISADETIDSALKVVNKSGTAEEQAAAFRFLKERGISGTDAKRIVSNYMKATDGGKLSKAPDGSEGRALNLSKWEEDVVDILQQAADFDSIQTIITPGKGDVPFIIQKYQLAATLAQFKGFLVTANSRIFAAGIMKSDARTMAGMSGLVAMGMLSYIVRSHLAGREPNMDADNLLFEGLARSGAMGIMFDVVHLFGPGGDLPSRFTAQNRLDYFGGPSVRTLKIGSEVYSDLIGGEVDEDTVDKIWRAAPLQNFWGFQATARLIGE